MKEVKHPAVYTDVFIPVFYDILKDYSDVFDPFAGTGKIAMIKELGYKGKIICGEIEKDFSLISKYNVDEWIIGDSEKTPFKDQSISSICTSPTYGNRMADHFNYRDSSKRITYQCYLGKDLDKNNTGRMNWGSNYMEKHKRIYKEMYRILKKDGLFVLNISNHIRKGIEIDVTKFHIDYLVQLGFELVEKMEFKTPRMRFGKNSDKRTDNEFIIILKK